MKKYQSPEIVFENLVKLRDDLNIRFNAIGLTSHEQVILMKINSCLYRHDGKLVEEDK
jgi:hypothetical protein